VGLTKFGPAAFKAAGFQPFVRNEFITIENQEITHVNFLTTTINTVFGVNMAVPACVYNFDTALASVQNFVTFAAILERTGVSAYVGANHLLTNQNFLTAAASIAVVEGRHSAFLNLLTNVNPSPGAFDPPLGVRAIISIAAALIKTCPYQLPAAPFAPLTVMAKKNTVQLNMNVPIAFTMPQGGATTATMPMGAGMMAGQVMNPMMANMPALAGLQCNWVAGLTQIRTPIVAMVMGQTGGMKLRRQMAGEGEMAQAPMAEGQMAQVAMAEGQMAQAPMEGQMAQAPMAEGQMAQAPMEGQMAQAPMEGQMAQAPMEGQMAQAPMEGQMPKTPMAEGQMPKAPMQGQMQQGQMQQGQMKMQVVPACQVPMGVQGFTQVVLFIVNADTDVALDNPMNVVAGPATLNVKMT
ncbi:hypothetical protein HK101_002357, partial [Irineochytrium annulatum]